MEKTLKQRTLSSSRWVAVGHIFSQVLRLGGNLILTRLLVPEMFGVMSLITVIMVGLTMFSDVGLLQNIVHSKRGGEPDYLNTAWTIQIIRGFFLFFFTLVLSYGLYFLGREGYVSSETVYGNVNLPIILAVMSVSVIFQGFNSIHILVLNRKLMMGRLVTIDLISQMIGLCFMLVWAWYFRDIWALVGGGILSSIIKMILSHSVIKYRCFFKWDKEAVHEIFHFGKWVFLSSIFGFIMFNGDRAILGGLVAPEMLGVYTVAFFLANALKTILLKLISSVFFPLLSETYRDSPSKIENIYYKIRNKIDAVTFFISGFMFSLGDLIIKALYDSRYYDAGWMLEVLSLSLVTAGFLLSKECFLAYGKSKIVTSITFIQMMATFILIPLLFFMYGMVGAVWAIVVVSIVQAIISSIFMKIYIFYDIKKELLMFPLVFIGYFLGDAIKSVFLEANCITIRCLVA